MKNQRLVYLTLSLGICSGIILANRFMVSFPEWLSWVLILIAGMLLIASRAKFNKKD